MPSRPSDELAIARRERPPNLPFEGRSVARKRTLVPGIRCALGSRVEFQLTGSVIAAVVATPYIVEILRQVPLLARVMSALPAEVRAGLPPHPRRPWLALFGSARFFFGLFRYALRTDPRAPLEMVALKREMRASAIREAVFCVALVITVTVLWRHGWRPL